MPVELESGRLQLTDDEMLLYTRAATLLADVQREPCLLHEPMMREQFAKLYMAHCVVVDDSEFLDEITVIAAAELARRKCPH